MIYVNNSVLSVIVLASYNESENLQVLLNRLLPELDSSSAVVIADDSEPDEFLKIENLIEEVNSLFMTKVHVLHGSSKQGRGAAIRAAFSYALETFPSASKFLEADSDGSHRYLDILKLLSMPMNSDMVIGSRYLPESEIIGWSISRRIMSWSLNRTIPMLLGVSCSDITNGLRAYNKPTVQAILSEPQKNLGFIYLSEVAKVLVNKGFSISETPIRFEERIHGVSSVTASELKASLKGVVKLLVDFRK